MNQPLRHQIAEACGHDAFGVSEYSVAASDIL